MKSIIAGALALVTVQFSFAQNVKDVGTFSTLKAFDKIPVVLIPSNSNKVEVDGKKANDVQVVNNNGELKIKMTTTKLMQGDDVKVKVFFDRLSDIQASQGSTITSQGAVEGNRLSLTANEGSNINIDVAVKALDVKANTGGQLSVSGSADNQTAVVNTGAKYDGKSLHTATTGITVNAGGDAQVYATESVDAKTRAGGIIRVYGNPSDKKTSKFAGGKIEFK